MARKRITEEDLLAFQEESQRLSQEVEVKYDAFLPEIVKLAVQVPNRQGTACSKYALCRRYD